MKENLKRFRIEFTVDVHHEGVTKDWDWSNDDIKDSALQELECMSPAPDDITFSEVENPWHTGIPSEEGWYLQRIKSKNNITYDTDYYENGDWKHSCIFREIVEWQKIEEKKDGHIN